MSAQPAKARPRYRRTTVSVDVDVDISDIIREIDDDDLIDECKSRGLMGPESKSAGFALDADDIDELRALLMRNNVIEALILLERMLPRDVSGLPEYVERYFRSHP